MSPRFLILTSALAMAVPCAPPLFAQDTVQPEVQNAPVSFLGEANTTGVLVRSGPNENFYPTARLNKGDQVTVVGIKSDWLKILPPEGSFSYIAKKYVDAAGNTGSIKGSDVSVRAGSSLVPQKGTIQTRLQDGDKVTILGEQDEYYKVKPPEGAFVFVSKQFVNPVHALASNPAGPAGPSTPTGHTPDNNSSANNSSGNPSPRPARNSNSANPDEAIAPPVPTSQPAEVASAETDYDSAEAAYNDAAAKPLEEQPLDTLITQYTALADNTHLPATLRRNATARLANLRSRQDSQKDMLAVKKLRDESNERLAKLKAEQEQIQAHMRGIQYYTAVGTLQPSELQTGGTTLYRLTDPGTGHTVVYVRPDDTVGQYVNNFVGVKGDVVADANLGVKVLNPTSISQVDPNAVNGTVTAQMIPQSMLPHVAGQ
jgi:uncharacterized protein YgiM (DUF1202 family)